MGSFRSIAIASLMEKRAAGLSPVAPLHIVAGPEDPPAAAAPAAGSDLAAPLTTADAYSRFPEGTRVWDMYSNRPGVVAKPPQGEFGDMLFVSFDNGETHPVKWDQLKAEGTSTPMVDATPSPAETGTGTPAPEAAMAPAALNPPLIPVLAATDVKAQAEAYRQKLLAEKKIRILAASVADDTLVVDAGDDRKVTFAELKKHLTANEGCPPLEGDGGHTAGKRGGFPAPYKADTTGTKKWQAAMDKRRIKAEAEEGKEKVEQPAAGAKDEGEDEVDQLDALVKELKARDFMGAELEYPGFIALYKVPGLPEHWCIMATPWFNEPDMLDCQLQRQDGQNAEGFDIKPFPLAGTPVKELADAYVKGIEEKLPEVIAGCKAEDEKHPYEAPDEEDEPKDDVKASRTVRAAVEFIGYIPKHFDNLMAALKRDGITLFADAKKPQVATLKAAGMTESEILVTLCSAGMSLEASKKALTAGIAEERTAAIDKETKGTWMHNPGEGIDRGVAFDIVIQHGTPEEKAELQSDSSKLDELFNKIYQRVNASRGKAWAITAIKLGLKADKYMEKPGSRNVLEPVGPDDAPAAEAPAAEGLKEGDLVDFIPEEGPESFTNGWTFVRRAKVGDVNDDEELAAIDEGFDAGFLDPEREEDKDLEVEFFIKSGRMRADMPGSGVVRKGGVAAAKVVANPPAVEVPVPEIPADQPAPNPSKVPPAPSSAPAAVKPDGQGDDAPPAGSGRPVESVGGDIPTTTAPAEVVPTVPAVADPASQPVVPVTAAKVVAEATQGTVRKDEDIYCSKCGKDLVVGDKYFSNNGTGIDAYPHYCSLKHLEEAVKDGSDERGRKDEEADPHARNFAGEHPENEKGIKSNRRLRAAKIQANPPAAPVTPEEHPTPANVPSKVPAPAGPPAAQTPAAPAAVSQPVVAATNKPMPTAPPPPGKKWTFDQTLDNGQGDWSLEAL